MRGERSRFPLDPRNAQYVAAGVHADALTANVFLQAVDAKMGGTGSGVRLPVVSSPVIVSAGQAGTA